MLFHRTIWSGAATRLTAVLLAAMAGCGPQPIPGGTPGILTTDGNPLRDVQLTVFMADSGQRVGYGVTGGDGSFALITADTSGPLQLEPGDYVVTLESVGVPAELPHKYLDRATTPLKVGWAEGGKLQLNVPGLKLK